jgi:hypothetical protein
MDVEHEARLVGELLQLDLPQAGHAFHSSRRHLP